METMRMRDDMNKIEQLVDIDAFAKPFVWGVSDCCLAVADCLVALGLPDPTKEYRGKYASAAEFFEMAAPKGGFEKVIATGMRECGYIEDPDGFVGLVETALGPTACIKSQGYWWAKSEYGAQGFDECHVYFRWTHSDLQT